ncbi:hypothetical protein N7478_012413 [Penicillium angulare]|uniref:uncharacterized protein n=1 Tax=Penicillium angulare TaxID=116970 RepID=UPI0025420E4E|nr:uncharacterized protein N7478_012413 [Penicillium angulare]KAJ5259432.1 hypothetical protein N7478_012413 [Penicillium angulare]
MLEYKSIFSSIYIVISSYLSRIIAIFISTDNISCVTAASVISYITAADQTTLKLAHEMLTSSQRAEIHSFATTDRPVASAQRLQEGLQGLDLVIFAMPAGPARTAIEQIRRHIILNDANIDT